MNTEVIHYKRDLHGILFTARLVNSSIIVVRYTKEAIELYETFGEKAGNKEVVRP